MAENRVVAERQIAASANRVFEILVDYREQHPKILPPAFSDYRVEQGGIGAGTVFSYRLTAGGRNRAYRMAVTEPTPGRVLQEADQSSELVTTFTVTPESDRSRVRIETVWPGARGIGGIFERLFAPRVLRRLYADELDRLDRLARGQPAG